MKFRVSAIVFLALVSTVPVQAQTGSTAGLDKVTIPKTRVIQFTSAINGEPYAISVDIPSGPPPKGGYPVLYVLDGGAYFTTAHLFSVTMEEKAPVVVGIGHDILSDDEVISRYAGRAPGDSSPLGLRDVNTALQKLRVLDLTLPLAPEHRGPSWFGDNEGGNVDAFLEVIETEIKPKVAAIANINPADQALFGHSYGGLAVVRALLTEPDAFRTFIASSPSLWWDGGAVLAGQGAFATKIEAGKSAPRVLITAAADEPDIPMPPQSFLDNLPPDKQTELVPYLQMRATWPGTKTGARAFTDQIAALKGGEGYEVKYEIITDADHPGAPFTTIDRGIHYAFDN